MIVASSCSFWIRTGRDRIAAAWARTATQHDELAEYRYRAIREKGKTHGPALRCVADRLLGVLCAMLRDRTHYQPRSVSTSSVTAASTHTTPFQRPPPIAGRWKPILRSRGAAEPESGGRTPRDGVNEPCCRRPLRRRAVCHRTSGGARPKRRPPIAWHNLLDQLNSALQNGGQPPRTVGQARACRGTQSMRQRHA